MKGAACTSFGFSQCVCVTVGQGMHALFSKLYVLKYAVREENKREKKPQKHPFQWDMLEHPADIFLA